MATYQNYSQVVHPRIVVFDQDADTREAVGCALRMEGLPAYEAGSLMELHELLRHERIAYIVSDQEVSLIDDWDDEEFDDRGTRPSICSLAAVMSSFLKHQTMKMFERVTNLR